VPDWIGAIGTSLAFFTAFYVIFRDHQTQRRREQEEDARQARLILSWAEAFETSEVIATDQGLKPRHRFEAVIRNASSEPIVDCLVEISIHLDDLAYSVTLAPARCHVKIVPPGEHREPVQLAPDWATQAVVRITFTDSNGRRWLRDTHGELSRVRKFTTLDF
jgi:hypothetical protein